MTLMGLIETPVEHGLFYLCVSLLVYTALWQTRGTDFVTMVLHNLSLRRSRYDQLLWEFGLLEKKFEDQLNEDRAAFKRGLKEKDQAGLREVDLLNIEMNQLVRQKRDLEKRCEDLQHWRISTYKQAAACMECKAHVKKRAANEKVIAELEGEIEELRGVEEIATQQTSELKALKRVRCDLERQCENLRAELAESQKNLDLQAIHVSTLGRTCSSQEKEIGKLRKKDKSFEAQTPKAVPKPAETRVPQPAPAPPVGTASRDAPTPKAAPPTRGQQAPKEARTHPRPSTPVSEAAPAPRPALATQAAQAYREPAPSAFDDLDDFDDASAESEGPPRQPPPLDDSNGSGSEDGEPARRTARPRDERMDALATKLTTWSVNGRVPATPPAQAAPATQPDVSAASDDAGGPSGAAVQPALGRKTEAAGEASASVAEATSTGIAAAGAASTQGPVENSARSVDRAERRTPRSRRSRLTEAALAQIGNAPLPPAANPMLFPPAEGATTSTPPAGSTPLPPTERPAQPPALSSLPSPAPAVNLAALLSTATAPPSLVGSPISSPRPAPPPAADPLPSLAPHVDLAALLRNASVPPPAARSPATAARPANASSTLRDLADAQIRVGGFARPAPAPAAPHPASPAPAPGGAEPRPTEPEEPRFKAPSAMWRARQAAWKGKKQVRFADELGTAAEPSTSASRPTGDRAEMENGDVAMAEASPANASADKGKAPVRLGDAATESGAGGAGMAIDWARSPRVGAGLPGLGGGLPGFSGGLPGLGGGDAEMAEDPEPPQPRPTSQPGASLPHRQSASHAASPAPANADQNLVDMAHALFEVADDDDDLAMGSGAATAAAQPAPEAMETDPRHESAASANADQGLVDQAHALFEDSDDDGGLAEESGKEQAVAEAMETDAPRERREARPANGLVEASHVHARIQGRIEGFDRMRELEDKILEYGKADPELAQVSKNASDVMQEARSTPTEDPVDARRGPVQEQPEGQYNGEEDSARAANGEHQPSEAAMSTGEAGKQPAATHESLGEAVTPPTEGMSTAGTGQSKKIDPRVVAKWQYPVLVKPKNRRRG